MTESKWMMHLDLRCGSIEYVGTDLPPEALAALMDVLARLGLVAFRDSKESKEETT